MRRRREREESGFASAKMYIVGFDEVLFWELVIAGPSSYCIERLQELLALGLERLVIVGPGRGTDPDEVKQTEMRFVQEVLPAL